MLVRRERLGEVSGSCFEVEERDQIREETEGEPMKVTVKNAPKNPMSLISEAAGTCYGKPDVKPSRVSTCVKNGHTSVIEHVSVTLEIGGISRSCLAQLTRHRMASFSVMSQRYCEVGGDDWYVIPPSVVEAGEEVGFCAEMEKAAKAYRRMLAKGVRKEDARFLLPEATKTNLVMTMNMRSLQNFLSLRLDKSAQWEIRELAEKIEQTLMEMGCEWSELMALLKEVRNG